MGKVITFRLLGKLNEEYYDTTVWNDRDCYENVEDWYKYKKECTQKLIDFERKVRELLGLTDSLSFKLTNVLSEIFTVVAFYNEKNGASEAEERTRLCEV